MLNHSDDEEYKGSSGKKFNFLTPIKDKNYDWKLGTTCGDLAINLFDSNRKSNFGSESLILVMPNFEGKMIQ